MPFLKRHANGPVCSGHREGRHCRLESAKLRSATLAGPQHDAGLRPRRRIESCTSPCRGAPLSASPGAVGRELAAERAGALCSVHAGVVSTEIEPLQGGVFQSLRELGHLQHTWWERQEASVFQGGRPAFKVSSVTLSSVRLA